MSRLSREKKREQKHAARSAASVATPIAVHVPVGGAGASVGGVPVHSAPGEEIQHAVLNHLRRIALATGHPVLATVTDERIGYVVPLRVHGDGSSAFAADPLRVGPPEPPRNVPPLPARPEAAPPAGASEHAFPAPPAGPAAAAAAPRPPRDEATHTLRRVTEPMRDTAPTFPLRAVPEPQPSAGTAPTFALRAVPEPTGATPPATPPGTATAPTGEFGPPPVMSPKPADPKPTDQKPSDPKPAAAPAPAPASSTPAEAPAPAAATRKAAAPTPYLEPEPDPKPTPARGFDAVAEAVLGDDPRSTAGDGGAVLLAEPMARVSEAVKEGRIEEAATLAERTVAEASSTLGPDHPEVLRLRELTAYIAYLAGDALRAFHLSIDLARIHRGARDPEGAYGNVQSAAAAWRAVRDPEQGLSLGRDLIGLWTELTAEDGPAADDIEQLESARARMNRLAERARRSAAPPPTS
jgi:hypothetical protein